MRNIAVLGLAALAAGCGASVSETRDPFGQRALLIRCGVKAEECQAKAKEICPGGYDVLASGEDRAVVSSGTVGNPQTMFVPENLLQVRCR